MAKSDVRTDPIALQRIVPGLSRIEWCRWRVEDDSDDGIPGLVSTWVDIVAEVTPELADFLAQYAQTEVTPPPARFVNTDMPTAGWHSGPELAAALGIMSWGVEAAAINGTWVAVRLSQGG